MREYTAPSAMYRQETQRIH